MLGNVAYAMKEGYFKGGLFVSAVVLSMACFEVLVQAANGEPFVSFRSFDALVQIGVLTGFTFLDH